MNTMQNRLLKEYAQVKTHSGVAYATPHRLVQMLFEGALDKIASAKGHMMRGDLAQKAGQISATMAILDGLRMSLDKSAGEIAQNLDDLYDYMERQLLRANYENAVPLLDEVSALLGEIKNAWDAISDMSTAKPQARAAS